MPKYIVALTESAFYSIPVEAENKEAAEQKARAVIATTDYPADFVCVELTEDVEEGELTLDEVGDAVFERFGGAAA